MLERARLLAIQEVARTLERDASSGSELSESLTDAGVRQLQALKEIGPAVKEILKRHDVEDIIPLDPSLELKLVPSPEHFQTGTSSPQSPSESFLETMNTPNARIASYLLSRPLQPVSFEELSHNLGLSRRGLGRRTWGVRKILEDLTRGKLAIVQGSGLVYRPPEAVSDSKR